MGTGTYSVYAICTDKVGNSTTSVTKSVTITQSAIISFNKNGGTGTMSNVECDVDNGCTLPTNNFLKTGHTFKGWATSSDGSVKYSDRASIKVSSDTILYAVWEANVYSVSYGGSGYSNPSTNPVRYTYGKGKTLYPASKANANFVGWYLDEGLTQAIDNISTTQIGDLTLWPKFANQIYTLTYNNEGGSGCTSRNGVAGDAWGALCTPAKSGHTFGGWYTGTDGTGTKVTASSIVNGNLDVYAKWNPVSYSISYVDCNSYSGPISYTYGKGVSSFTNPTKTGYTFIGFYSDSSYSTKVTSISTSSIGNKTLYCKWTAQPYTLTYNSQGGTTCSPSTKTGNYGNAWGSLCTPTKTGYIFDGWYTGLGGSGTEVTSSTLVTGDVTVHAKWDPIIYTISFNGNGNCTLEESFKSSSRALRSTKIRPPMILYGRYVLTS